MSNYKNLADLVKVCSVLPIFAVMPAMAEGVDVQSITDGASEQSVTQAIYFNPETDLVFDGAKFVGNENTNPSGKDNKGFGTVVFSKTDTTVTFNNVLFENNKNAFVGGAIANYADAEFVVNNSQFVGNHAYYDGGAIGNYGGLTITDSSFEGNTADYAYDAEKKDWSIAVEDDSAVGGGAISLGSISETTVGTITGSTFKNNKSGTNGGAIGTRLAQNPDNKKNNNVAKLDIAATFIGNEALKDGGAIYNTFWNDNGLGKGDGVTVAGIFKENKAGRFGGAIYNDGAADANGKGGVMTINSAEFKGNEASRGGAIFNGAGKMDILGTADKRVVFEDNKAYVGGAFTDVYTNNAETFIKDALFEENHAGADAGAAGFYGKVDVENTIFRENTAAITVDGVTADIGNSDGGGAIMVGGTSDVSLTKVQFVGNESGARGGAISARHLTGYELDIDTATFTNNKAGNFGGGIANVYGGTVNMNNVDFVSNSATKAGGAIYNGKDMNYGGSTGSMSTNHGILNIAGTNTFTGNTASEFGGAIYNDNGGTINMSGTNTFANNTHGKNAAANDIYNLGTLNITDGTTTIGGGIAGNEGTLVLENGATLNIGTALIQQGTVNLDGAIVASAMNSTSFGRFAGDVTVGGNATLDLTVGSVGTYDIFAGKTIDVSKVTVGDTYLVESGADGIVITTKAVEDIAADTGLTTQAAGLISGLANSTNKNVQKISLAAQQILNSGDVETVEKEVAKANPDGKPVVQSVATSVQNQVLAVAAGRMSGTAPVVGRSGGDEAKSNGFWAQGLFNKSKYADQFHGYTRGFALGADTMINSAFKVGAGFAYNNSDIHTVGRGHTDIDANTLFVYGQYKPTNWFVNGTLAYTMAEYTEDAKMFGDSLVATYDVDSYGAQIMTGYDFASGITTEVGARYLHIAQDSYSNGLTSVGSMDSDFLTGVAGMKYAFTIENDWAVKLRPELRAAVTYDFVSDGDEAVVTMPGVASYKVAGERLKRLGGEFGIGLTALYNGMEITAMYDLDLHEDYTSHTGMIKFRGQF